MAAAETQRRLAAILSADVEGYSRLMGADEEATVETLTAYRELFTAAIAGQRGRVVDAKGDAILAEFASVVDAVACAVEIQRELGRRNAELPEERRMHFRIGINLGDVLVKDEVIYGDGVNIAARLEALAEPGGVAISGNVYEQVRNKLPLRFEFLGEKEVKHIARPVPVYRLVMEAGDARPASGTGEDFLAGLAAPELPDKPSIAVLAFENMSGDPEQEYFSDGISEDIITDLAKISSLFVIARNATFAYKGQTVSPRQVGRELGVRYLLEGSVRKAGNRARITAQLIEAGSGNHLWAERYDRGLEDVFAVQDEITAEVVTALDVKLVAGEQARIWRQSLKDPQARDHYYRGMQGLNRAEDMEEYGEQARREFEQVTRLEPESPLGFVGMGMTHWLDAFRGWSESPKRSLELAGDLGREALALDENSAGAHSLLGNVLTFARDYEGALAEGRLAAELEPNSANVLSYYALSALYSGDGERAIDLMKRAIRLSPIYPGWYLAVLAAANLLLGRFEVAAAAARRAKELHPEYGLAYTLQIRALCGLGRLEEARAVAQELRKVHPRLSVVELQRRFPYRDATISERAVAALRSAGLD